MRESAIEEYFVWAVMLRQGLTYKFQSPTQRGVSDRIACMPNGETWFVELKTKDGRLSPLQELFAMDMRRLGQQYACLWSIEGVDEWASRYDLTKNKPPTFCSNETAQ